MHQVITTKVAVATFQYLVELTGRASCGTVADELDRKGYTSKNGDTISRMAVWRALKGDVLGDELLSGNKRRMGWI